MEYSLIEWIGNDPHALSMAVMQPKETGGSLSELRDKASDCAGLHVVIADKNEMAAWWSDNDAANQWSERYQKLYAHR